MKYFCLVIALFMASLTHATQVYKWVDENGQTQFSQFPPAKESNSKKAETINVKAQPAADAGAAQRLQDMRQKLLESSVDRNQAKAESEEEAKKNEAYCKQAQQNLRNLQSGGRFYEVDENGERRYFDDKELKNRVKKAQQQVDKFCTK